MKKGNTVYQFLLKALEVLLHCVPGYNLNLLAVRKRISSKPHKWP